MKKIALINDLSGFGRCSLTAAIPVISALGLQSVPLPTAVLSAQTGFDSFFCEDYTDKMNLITDEWSKMKVHFDGIHSGYLASTKQIENVLYFLDKFKADDTVYLADPVMGDYGRMVKHLNDDFLTGLRTLCQKADICTPNLAELCLLSNTDYNELTRFADSGDYTKRIADVCHILLKNNPCSTVLVTGIIRHCDDKIYMGNLAVNAHENTYMETPYTGKSFSGTGDLFAAVICGAVVKGMSVHNAIKLATDFLQPAIEEASLVDISSKHGVFFEKYLDILIKA